MGNLLWVLKLFTIYATDRQTDKSNAYCPLPYGWGHNNQFYLLNTYNTVVLICEYSVYVVTVRRLPISF